jgi:hypothetical protein
MFLLVTEVAVHIGYASGDSSHADFNVFLGNSAGRKNETGHSNVFVGNGAGSGNITGTNNVLIGRDAGYFLTDASNTLFITGSGTTTPLIYGEFDTTLVRINGKLEVKKSSESSINEKLLKFSVADDATNYLSIENATTTDGRFLPVFSGYNGNTNQAALYIIGSISSTQDNGSSTIVKFDARQLTGIVLTRPIFEWANYGNSKMIMLANGNVGIGETSPTHILHINGVGRSTSTTWATSSDMRVKENIQPISNAINNILKLNPVTFQYTPDYIIQNPGYEGKYTGFLAQEVQSVFPEMVTETIEKVGGTTFNDFLLLNQGKLIPVMIEAIKEQQQIIEQQQTEINHLKSLENEVSELKSLVNTLVTSQSAQGNK